MDKPKLFYNNVLRDAQKGDDGTVYASCAKAFAYPGNDNALLGTLSLASDLGGVYTGLVGMEALFTASGNKYTITGQADIVNVMPATANWRAVCKGDEVFCAVAEGTDKCATSPDGVSWTERTLPASRAWYGIAWGGSVFCAVAVSTDKCATSPDGITWTERTLPASRNWKGISWNGTVFCAIAYGPTDKCATSPDGITWTERTLPASRNWYSIAWNGALFCAVAYGPTNKCATSPDGITWTEQTISASLDWRGIAWNGSLFCAVASGTDKCATSTDGATWIERTMPGTYSWMNVAWNGVQFLAVASSTDKAATSPDGITWTERTTPSSGDRYSICSDTSTGMFIMQPYNTNDSNLSYDGIDWPTRSLSLFEGLQNIDRGTAFTIRASLIGLNQDPTRIVPFLADNGLAPVSQGLLSQSLTIIAHLPNMLIDGGFESGALSPNWSVLTANIVIETTNKLEGAHSISWDTALSGSITQNVSGKKIEKDKTYRLLFKGQSITGNPTSTCVRAFLRIRYVGTDIDTSQYAVVTTSATWFALDFTADYSTDEWYLTINFDAAQKGSATKIVLDEFYLYEKPTVNSMIFGNHNIVGMGGCVFRSYKMSPLRSTVGSDDYTQENMTRLSTSDNALISVGPYYDPIYWIYLNGYSGANIQIGELYLGDYWQLPKYAAATDPYQENDNNLRELSLSFKNIAPAYRKSNVSALFRRFRDRESIWVQWDTDNPVFMEPASTSRKAPYNPYRIDLDLNLVEKL